MNTLDVMRHGHRTVLQSVEGLETKRWDEPRVVGVWSTKQVIAHPASFEAILVDVLAAIQEDAADTPVLDLARGLPGHAFTRSRLERG